MMKQQQLDLKNRRKWPVWLTVEETANLLRVSRSSVYEWCRQGKLPHKNLGNTIRIDRDGMFFQARKGQKST